MYVLYAVFLQRDLFEQILLSALLLRSFKAAPLFNSYYFPVCGVSYMCVTLCLCLVYVCFFPLPSLSLNGHTAAIVGVCVE